ncbi:MAG: hypothetical protein ACPGN3_10205 [Opitutales bacterium]
MRISKSLPLATITVAFASWVSAQVPVYLTPDIGANPLKSVPNETLDKQAPQPVLDEEQAAQGWKWVDLPGTYTGHVESAQVTKALKVEPSTLVYASPDAESTVLTVLQDTDEHTVNASSDDWAEVTFDKSITVYFLDSAPVIPANDGLNAPIAEEAPSPVVAPAPVDATPMPEQETIEELDVFSSDETEITQLGPELTTKFKPPSDILITYSGVLHIAKRKFFRGKPKMPTELRSQDGKKRIAWLNLDNCVLHRSINELNGLTVAVDAVVTEGSWNKDVILDVRNIRVLY